MRREPKPTPAAAPSPKPDPAPAPPAAAAEAMSGPVTRGVLAAITADGALIVRPSDDDGPPIACDVLETGQGPPADLTPGDTVLVLRPTRPGENGCVLGRVARYRPGGAAPNHVVIEAAESVAIRCGAGAIELRGDGKVLIRGQDVVSRAARTNRIKGGSVAIN